MTLRAFLDQATHGSPQQRLDRFVEGLSRDQCWRLRRLLGTELFVRLVTAETPDALANALVNDVDAMHMRALAEVLTTEQIEELHALCDARWRAIIESHLKEGDTPS